MQVLVADKLEKSALDGLSTLNLNIVFEPDLEGETLAKRIAEVQPEILIVRGTKVSGEMIKSAPLKLIIRAGAGYNTIDTKAATEHGTKVANCPGMNSIAVAELTMGLIVALDRFIPDNVSDLRKGVWNKKKYGKAQGLAGQTIGLFGLGSIGMAVAKRAQAFDMKVIAFSRSPKPDAEAMGIEMVSSLDELAERSNIVSLHCALNDETRGKFGKDFFSKMKPGSLFINTSRAEVIDQAALLEAIEEKGIRAGLDVFQDEPTGGEGTYNGPLCNNPNVYCTHHIGASTNQAQEAVASETVRIVEDYVKKGEFRNAVN
jgi:D-3-phosphoglycerate dehydrogenase